MRQQSHAVAAGASLILAPGGAPWSLSVLPEAGATVTLAVTATPASAVGADGAGAAWHPLGEPLTAETLIVFPGPVTALRVSAAGAGTTVELISG
ncbi:hypothetical protein [Thiocystis violascens]|uniref:Uncharacterized protein n=1 Tax=Thiocystis violascens (strain ATCC 17096 / DSM 198 / 6111) TaxID=765911 RepID=I3YGW4_THIV6|nr:hypothetical protein [Thiocystis violascens]AFL76232.1 hypothetical protein Thivi_4429 [Thiocystis violascens DSM 198]